MHSCFDSMNSLGIKHHIQSTAAMNQRWPQDFDDTVECTLNYANPTVNVESALPAGELAVAPRTQCRAASLIREGDRV